MGERRTKWTTSEYLSLWIDKWGQNLQELGFGSMVDGKFVILNKQFQKIIKITERVLYLDSLDGGVKEDKQQYFQIPIYQEHTKEYPNPALQ